MDKVICSGYVILIYEIYLLLFNNKFDFFVDKSFNHCFSIEASICKVKQELRGAIGPLRANLRISKKKITSFRIAKRASSRIQRKKNQLL